MSIIFFLILGIFTSLLFPPFFFVPLGFIIFPLICKLIDYYKINRSILNLLINTLGFGIGFFLTLLFWIQDPFFVFDETKNFFFISFILILLLSIIFSVIASLIISYNRYLPTFILVPIIFISIEFTISIFLFGFPWITFSLIISSIDEFSFIYKYFGSFISSYLIIQIFCLPYLFLRTNQINNKNNYIIVFFLITLLSLGFIYSYKNQKDIVKREIELEIFQLNFDNDFKNNNSVNRLNKILTNIKNSDAQVLIFAENNYPYLVKEFNFEKLRETINENQIVIIGSSRVNERGEYLNTLLDISTKKISYFDKKILVPFGEFLPFRNYLSFLIPISGISDYTPGVLSRKITHSNKLSYIPVICYEIIFYWKLINNNNDKSDFIINITNDIWFGDYSGPYQHFYLSKIRAAEFNKPLIRVSNNGISGIIDHNGKILSTIKLNDSGSLKHKLELSDYKNYNLNHRLLNYIFYLILIFIFIFNFFMKNDFKN